jgi:hypothetical protein
MSETLFSKLKASILRTEPQPTAVRVISVTGSNDYAELPQGFFRVEAASGKTSLGYNCPAFLCWDVGPTVVVGRERITLAVPREELPLVKLNFRSPTAGMQQVGSMGIVDTDSLDGNDGSVGYDGVNAPRRDGFDFI